MSLSLSLTHAHKSPHSHLGYGLRADPATTLTAPSVHSIGFYCTALPCTALHYTALKGVWPWEGCDGSAQQSSDVFEDFLPRGPQSRPPRAPAEFFQDDDEKGKSEPTSIAIISVVPLERTASCRRLDGALAGITGWWTLQPGWYASERPMLIHESNYRSI